MKLTIEQEGFKTTIESDSETADCVLQDFCQAMLGHGFQPVSIRDAIYKQIEMYEYEGNK